MYKQTILSLLKKASVGYNVNDELYNYLNNYKYMYGNNIFKLPGPNGAGKYIADKNRATYASINNEAKSKLSTPFLPIKPYS